MFKLSRNNAGDARDVAALRAAVFDELAGIWSCFSDRVANDALKLAGKDAALYALLTSTVADSDKLGGKAAALYALLTDLDTLKSTYFSGTSAKAALKLATARTINGVSFDGTANIELPAGESTHAIDSDKLGGKAAALYALLTDLDTLKSTYFSGTSAKTALVANRFPQAFISSGAFSQMVTGEYTAYVVLGGSSNVTGMPLGTTGCYYNCFVFGCASLTSGSATIIAVDVSNGTGWYINTITNGTWTGWKRILDANGFAVIATALRDNQSGYVIMVKSGNVYATGGPGGVTFASAFPNRLLGAMYHPTGGGVCLIATGTASGISMTVSTTGSYDWIAWGY